jgi:ATP-binding cassette subfamily B protein
MTDEQILSLLKDIEPLSLLSQTELQKILSFCEEIQIVENHSLLEMGKPWPGLYFIVQGQVIFICEISGKSVAYNKLSMNQSFGSLTSDAASDFSVYGGAPLTTLLYIPKHHFQSFSNTNPTLEKSIGEYKTQQAIQDFLIRSPLFSYVPTLQLRSLVSSLKNKNLLPNEILIRQGDEAKEAYIIGKGRFTVHVDERPTQVVRTMGPGELVGEIALIKQTKRTTNVIAQTEANVFVLPQTEFITLFQEQEQLNEWVNRLVQERLGTTQTELQTKSIIRDYKTWLKDRLGLFPVVQQDNPQESGAACLAMMCRYYGKPVDIECMRLLMTAHYDEMSDDITLSALTQAAERMGFLPLAVLSSYEHLMDSCLPVIVGWEGKHWAVVYQITDHKVSMVDPALGAQKISRKTFIERWTFSTLYFKPSERFFGRT